MKNLLYLNKQRLILTLTIFIVLVIFFLPVKMNNLCKPNSPCPPSNTFIKITELKNPTLIGINYLYLIIKIIISYLLASIIIHLTIKTNKRPYKYF